MPAVPPLQEANKPHSTEYGSIEVELVTHVSHDHELYKEDNGSVYYHLEEATRGTIYSASINPFQRGKDGHGAWLALTSQYAGNDKWEAELKRQDDLSANVSGKDRTHSHWRDLSGNTTMHSSPCSSVPNTSAISCQTNIHR